MLDEDPLRVPVDELRRRLSVKWQAYPPDVLPLFVAELDCRLAPAVTAALSDLVSRADTGYPYGRALAEAYAGFAGDRYRLAVEARCARAVCDVMTGIAVALQLRTEPGDDVVINSPVYPPFAEVVRWTGRRVVDVPLVATAGEWQLDLDALAAAFRAGARAWLLCSPHNPVGRVFGRAELQGAADLCEQHGVQVVADEVHGPVTRTGVPFVPFAALDGAAARGSLSVVSASKAWNLPGLKAALVVAADPEGGRALAGLPLALSGASLPGSVAGAAAFTDGREWLDAVRVALDERVDLLARLLAEMVPGARLVRPEGTAQAWVDLTGTGLGAQPAAAMLARGRVALQEGSDCGPGGVGHARITFGTSPEILREAVRRMALAVQRSG